MKRFFLLMIAGLFMTACGNQPKQHTDSVVDTYTIEQLAVEPLVYEGQTVRFEGVIDHMCRHSGDKMRVAQVDNNTFSMQVMLGDMMDQFSLEHEGAEVIITGVLHTAIRNLDELEDDQHDHGDDDHDHDHACDSTEEAIKRMAEKGISPDIRPYVELIAFEVK